MIDSNHGPSSQETLKTKRVPSFQLFFLETKTSFWNLKRAFKKKIKITYDAFRKKDAKSSFFDEWTWKCIWIGRRYPCTTSTIHMTRGIPECLYICVCIYVCISLSLSLCIHCVYTYIYVCIWHGCVCMYVPTYVCMCVGVHACVYTCMIIRLNLQKM